MRTKHEPIICRLLRRLVLLMICSSTSAVLAQESSPDDWKWNDPRDVGVPGMVHRTIESESMQRTVGYQIYLPPQYESEPGRSFPVVYFLHGAGGTESSDAGLAWRVHAEIEAGRIAPVIYVFPNGGARSGYRDSASNYVRSETMIIRELIPHIDAEYRTITYAIRGICGFSMGGGGSTRLFFKHPGLFSAVAGLAPALDRSRESGDGDNCYVHAAAYPEERRAGVRPYYVIGDDDFLLPRQEPFQMHLKELGINHTFVLHTGLGHNLGKLTELSADSMIRHMDRELSRALQGRSRQAPGGK